MQRDDAQLIHDYLTGDAEALAILVARYTPSVYAFCVRLCGDTADAADLTQETFIKAWKHIQRFDTNRAFKAWLFTIAHRTVIDHLRKRKNIPFSQLDQSEDQRFEETIPDAEALPDAVLQHTHFAKTLEDALQKLSFQYRSMVVLHLIEELTFDEIARSMKLSINTVKSQYRRALLQLRALLQDTMYGN